MDHLRQIAHDLKNSWYFRAWGLIWLVFVILGFVALGVLSNRSVSATRQLDAKLTWQNSSSMYLPRFHFHTGISPMEPGNEIFTNVSCHFHHQPIQTGPCASMHGTVPDIFHCVAVYGDTVEVFNHIGNESYDLGVSCNITTSGNLTQIGNMIGWGMEGQGNIVIGDNAHTSLWIHSTQFSIINLQRTFAQGHGQEVTLWERHLVYLSTVATPTNFYHVRVLVDGFGALRFTQQNLYSGWRATGDIGGTAFFLVCIHTFLMILVGFCLVNSSTFLGKSETKASSGTTSGHTYAPLDG